MVGSTMAISIRCWTIDMDQLRTSWRNELVRWNFNLTCLIIRCSSCSIHTHNQFLMHVIAWQYAEAVEAHRRSFTRNKTSPCLSHQKSLVKSRYKTNPTSISSDSLIFSCRWWIQLEWKWISTYDGTQDKINRDIYHFMPATSPTFCIWIWKLQTC